MAQPGSAALRQLCRSTGFGSLLRADAASCVPVSTSRRFSSIDSVLGQPQPSTSYGPWLWDVEQALPDAQDPMLCANPKKKLSVHRRGNRRIWYKIKKDDVVAKCRYCGQVSMPHCFTISGGRCTGECYSPPQKQYPDEYKPPC